MPAGSGTFADPFIVAPTGSQGESIAGQPVYAQVTLPTSGTLTTEVNPDVGLTTRLSLLDSSGNLLVQSDGQVGNPTGLITQSLPAGTYFLEVNSINGTTGDAMLTTTFVAASLPFENVPVGTLPVAMASGHFRGSALDFVVANAKSDSVSVVLGNGDGTYQSAVSYAVGDNPVAVAAVDLGNGEVDIVVATNTGTISVLRGNGDGTFQAAVSYAIPANLFYPCYLYIGDLGNGTLDIVVSTRSDVSVLIGNGDGTFNAAVTYGVGSSQIYSMISGDFGNGNTDVAVATANGVAVLLGNGDGTFQSAVTYLPGIACVGLVMGDFGRGEIDLVVQQAGTHSVTVLEGDGAGSFSVGTTYPVSSGASYLITADLGNGHLDLIAAGDGVTSTLSVLIGNGDGSFQPEITYAARVQSAGSAPMFVADLGNGHANLVAFDSQFNSASILLGKGDGTFHASTQYQLSGNPTSVVLGDVNGDTYEDLTFTIYGSQFNEAGYLVTLFNNGDGTFQGVSAYPTMSAPVDVLPTDLGNGIDLVTANYESDSITVMLGNGDGTFEIGQSYAVADRPKTLVDRDFNRDGRQDLAVLSEQAVSILLGNGDGTFQDAVIYNVGTGLQMVSRDFGNGHDDLAISVLGGVMVLLGNGDGSFQSPVFYSAGGLNNGLVAEDFGNGKIDLAVASQGGGVWVLLGNGDGTFQSGMSYLSSSLECRGLLAADFGTGKLDLVTMEPYSGGITVLLGNGDGTFSTGGTYLVSAGTGLMSLELVAADFNNGHLDVAVNTITPGGNTFTRNLTVFFGNGDGTFQATPSTTPLGVEVNGGVFPRREFVVADFGNGQMDVAAPLYNSGVNTVAVLLGNGDGTFQPAATYPAGSFPLAMLTADFGNGELDLAVANMGDNSVSILFGVGDGTFLLGNTVNTQQAIPLLADINGDTTLDSVIVAQDGTILFRAGTTQSPGTFGSAEVVNSAADPARSAAIVSTTQGMLIAALDSDADTISFYRRNAPHAYTKLSTLPVGGQSSRILSANLSDNLQTPSTATDLVVFNSGDGSVTIYRSDGAGGFLAPQTITVGVGGSSLSLVPNTSSGAPDIVISNQVTGGVTLLVNDGQGAFSVQEEFRAGAGPYTLTNGNVSSLQRTLGAIGGDLSGTGTMGIVTINPGANTYGALVGQGDASFLNVLVSTPLGFTPEFIVGGDLNGDQALDFAALDKASNTLRIFLGNGDGTFNETATLDAGNNPTGMTVADINNDSNMDLLVGNTFGDILILLGNGDGTFKPFERTDRTVPFVTKNLGNGVPSVILANQSLDNVLAQIRQAGTTNFSVGSFQQYRQDGLIGPGYLTLADLNSDTFDDLIVANTGSNNVLVYLGTSATTFSTTAMSFFAGTNPVHLDVGFLDADGFLDIAVANQGSNDVSILLGTGTAALLTYGPRLNSGGIGTNHVSIGNYDAGTVLDLLVTNGQSGNVTMLPGIGSAGAGTGFFNDTNPQNMTFGAPIVDTVAAPANNFVLRNDGSIFSFIPNSFLFGNQQVFGSSNITTLGNVSGGSLIVARDDNSLSLLTQDASGQFVDSLDFRDARLDDPSALQLIGSEIYVTNAGSNLPIIIELSAGIPVALLEGGVGRGVETNLQFGGNEFALLAVLTTGQSEGELIDDSSIDSSLVAGLGIPAVPTLGFGQEDAGSGSEELEEELLIVARDAETENAGNAWRNMVFGIWQAVQERHEEAPGELLNYLPEIMEMPVGILRSLLTDVVDGFAPAVQQSLDGARRVIFPDRVPVLGNEVHAPAESSALNEVWIDGVEIPVLDGIEYAPSANSVESSSLVVRPQVEIQNESTRNLAWAGLLAVLLPRAKRDEEAWETAAPRMTATLPQFRSKSR